VAFFLILKDFRAFFKFLWYYFYYPNSCQPYLSSLFHFYLFYLHFFGFKVLILKKKSDEDNQQVALKSVFSGFAKQIHLPLPAKNQIKQ